MSSREEARESLEKLFEQEQDSDVRANIARYYQHKYGAYPASCSKEEKLRYRKIKTPVLPVVASEAV